MKIKKGQKVYYFKTNDRYMGFVCEGIVEEITKDLTTGEITYGLNEGPSLFGYPSKLYLTFDQIYLSKKQIESEYKDELRYGALSTKLSEVEKLFYKVLDTCSEKLKDGITISGTEIKLATGTISRDLHIEGVGNVREEINKIKKDISELKKKFKTKTKRPVIDITNKESKNETH